MKYHPDKMVPNLFVQTAEKGFALRPLYRAIRSLPGVRNAALSSGAYPILVEAGTFEISPGDVKRGIKKYVPRVMWVSS